MLLLSICRNYEDAYTDPGSPASRRTSLGTYVLAMVDNQKKLLMQGMPFTVPAMSCSSLPTPCIHSDLTRMSTNQDNRSFWKRLIADACF